MTNSEVSGSVAAAERSGTEILSVAQMYQADRSAIASGISGTELMERAGRSVAEAIQQRWQPRPVAVLCGPGNNGGDGFVVAHYLSQAGWPVTVAMLGRLTDLKGDAAWAANRWSGKIEVIAANVTADAELVVDALFGAGLARPLEEPVLAILKSLQNSEVPIVSIDVPSGVDGDTGAVRGQEDTQVHSGEPRAFKADLTVTFFRKKPAHLLYPGRGLCGEVVCANIGIPEKVLEQIDVSIWENDPALWQSHLISPSAYDHKYRRGHVLVIGGKSMTGAGRLAARAALRTGAGMVTVACPPEAIDAYSRDTAALICLGFESEDQLVDLIRDRKISAVVVGPGLGVSANTVQIIQAILSTGVPTVLDADALTVFQHTPSDLWRMIKGPTVLTPHNGEFTRLFDFQGDRMRRALGAAELASAVMLFKGADTVVAAPDGALTINSNAPPWLATAGAGDVLSGIVGAYMSQQVEPFYAASAAVWVHGAAAAAFGPGLIADDLPDLIPPVLGSLR